MVKSYAKQKCTYWFDIKDMLKLWWRMQKEKQKGKKDKQGEGKNK